MRTKLTLIAVALLVLAAACHRKGGGGYLSPAPANASVAR